MRELGDRAWLREKMQHVIFSETKQDQKKKVKQREAKEKWEHTLFSETEQGRRRESKKQRRKYRKNSFSTLDTQTR